MPYETEVLADAPVHYWKLDETSDTTATDSGSTPSTGTYNGGLMLGEPGLVGERTCPKFDGVDDYVHLATGANLLGSEPAITIELWFKTADVNVAVPAILFEMGGSALGAAIYVYNGQLYAGITNSSTYQYVTTPVQSNATYHVVLLVDGPASTIKLYLNASLAATGAATPPSSWGGNVSGIGGPNSDTRTHLGLAVGTHATYFNGWIDEVALYTTLLPAARIQAHYNAGTGGGQQAITVDVAMTVGGCSVQTQAMPIIAASADMTAQGAQLQAGGTPIIDVQAALTAAAAQVIAQAAPVVDTALSATVQGSQVQAAVLPILTVDAGATVAGPAVKVVIGDLQPIDVAVAMTVGSAQIEAALAPIVDALVSVSTQGASLAAQAVPIVSLQSLLAVLGQQVQAQADPVLDVRADLALNGPQVVAQAVPIVLADVQGTVQGASLLILMGDIKRLARIKAALQDALVLHAALKDALKIDAKIKD